ncbi:MAG: nucleotide exchange factor GrpE [Candidatus Cardinium sp.]|uniref:nucleotide exchange factor GrpE n=1 Tax=Candidatus Cardinium sp. TP TaxID=2961955 RepID=UPI0021AF1E61|nr:nucleotide exchange factor GrpE [Candidatus Cardinium sp. TP]MCT4697312.1 nucleotide exchange factor GrpE [Candidatus Cardinium sp. TP]MDN5247262.1 nucleotide exchange factor GrpE [Candidatus Cardinium sp.]
MKLHDTDTNRKGCCKETVDKNQTAYCSEETTTPCCCNGEETMDQPCCCGRQEAAAQGGCCYEQKVEPEGGCCQSADRLSDSQPHVCSADIGSLEQMQTLLMEANDKYMRLYAEFDNFKKRAAKERIAFTDKANEQTLKELLPIVDDFERCIAALQGTEEAFQHIEGIKLIYDKIGAILKKYGVQEITITHGTAFNSDLHEAIMQQPVDNLEMQGKIVGVVEKGYLIHEYVLRFAKVIIGV